MSVRINTTHPLVSHPIRRPQLRIHHIGFFNCRGTPAQGLNGSRKTSFCVMSSAWDDKPYDLLPSGQRYYLDEGDVVDFLDSPKKLIPLDPSSYNPAAYLWKKISDIPEERRQRLLALLRPRLISRAWAIAGTKYVEPTLRKKLGPSLVSNAVSPSSPEYWKCRSSGGGPAPVSWIKFFNKAIFSSGDGKTYGRFFGGSLLSKLSNYFPLYFMVTQVDVVIATEQPCDLAYEFGDGVFEDLVKYHHHHPQDFPKPVKHPWPFSDQVVVYIRQVGPGVLVGQVWQEGQALEQLPKKLCGDILMIKEYR